MTGSIDCGRLRWGCTVLPGILGPTERLAPTAIGWVRGWTGRLTPVDQVARVAGALFYSPTEDSEAARLAARHFRSPRMPLPFPSLLIERRAALAGDEFLAQDWGSRAFGMVDDHPTPFARARRMVARFTAGVVERDAMRADRLRGVDRSRT